MLVMVVVGQALPRQALPPLPLLVPPLPHRPATLPSPMTENQ